MLVTRRSFPCLLLLCILLLTATVPANSQPHSARVLFRIKNDFVVVVPVMMGGKGPFEFALDTGATETVIDEKLAEELALQPIGRVTLTTVQGEMQVPLVAVPTLSLGGVAVHGIAASAMPGALPWPWKVRGILGEDFLKRFDVLLDYEHHVVEIGTEIDRIGDRFDGDRVELTVESRFRGAPVRNRLLVTTRSRSLGGHDLRLLLDSGANGLLLYRQSWMRLQGRGERQISTVGRAASADLRTQTERLDTLEVGAHVLRNAEAAIITNAPEMDNNGLLPTRLFHSVLICHAGRFVIFNPIRRDPAPLVSAR